MAEEAVRTRDKAKTRQRLLTAARELFYEDGICATGVSAVAERAGVTKMTLYSHFPSKDDLVAAYLEDSDRRWREFLERILSGYEDSRDRLLAVCDAYREYFTAREVLGFAVLVLFWGSAFSVVKVGLEYSTPVIFAGLRTLVGGLAILLVAVVWGGSPHLKRDWPIFLLLAAFNVVFFFGFQTLAILHLPSGTAAVLEYLQPMLVGLLARMILGESLSLAKIVGLVLGFSGIVAVSAGSIFGNISPAGVAFGAGSAFSWALGTVFFKRYEARISTMWAVALPFVVGGMMLTLFGFSMESWSEVSPTGTLFASLSYVSLVEIALAWLIWFGLIRAGEASRVAVYVFFVPLVSIVVGAIFLGERLTTSLLIGTVLIVTGIYVVNRSSTGKDKLANYSAV